MLKTSFKTFDLNFLAAFKKEQEQSDYIFTERQFKGSAFNFYSVSEKLLV